jgi:hypothetical protein
MQENALKGLDGWCFLDLDLLISVRTEGRDAVETPIEESVVKLTSANFKQINVNTSVY